MSTEYFKINTICIYLYIQSRVYYFVNLYRKYITNTKQVITYNTNKTSVLWRYWIVYLLKQIINYFDIEFEKVKFVKQFPEGEQSIIIGSKNSKITLCDIVDDINKSKKDRSINKIYLKMLVNTNNKKTCLKRCLIKYKDKDELYDHTLDNIATFEDIPVDDNSQIDVAFYKNKSLKSISLPYIEYKNKHINELLKKIEQND